MKPEYELSPKDANTSPTDFGHARMSQKIARGLKMDIITGRLASNEWLREETLVKQLKVSRTPIREALAILENEGFITSVPFKGKLVNEISVQTIWEHYLIMSALEELAVRTAGPILTPEDFLKLEQLVEKMDQLTKTGQFQNIQKYHRLFHNFFIEKINIPRLTLLLTEHYAVFTKRSDVPARLSIEPVREYREIVNALFAGDYELAGKLMRLHILRGREAQIERFKEFQEKP
jgi:DNA-binding GntR family transcriptional regulator